MVAQERPTDVPRAWKELLGEYSDGKKTICVLESDGMIYLRNDDGARVALGKQNGRTFRLADERGGFGPACSFMRAGNGSIVSLNIGRYEYKKINYGGEHGESFRIKPLRPLADLRLEARVAVPPVEKGESQQSDLVELTRLDSTIHLDIRYATTNNFMGAVFYSQARAFLQRPAAEALIRVQRALKPLGFSLLIHDAYRPWFVTKMFWDATPQSQKEFVADPAKGSRHNRGCAVDLSLYDLKAHRPVDMVSGYDEFSHRAYPEYDGGSSLQRWHRALLRQMMEAEGFRVFESEWWHFDFREWRNYPIGTASFEELR